MKTLKFPNLLFNKSYLTISVLGNSLKLNVIYTNTSTIQVDKSTVEINIYLPKKYKNTDNVEIINLAISKLYDEIASTEIAYSMDLARFLLKFAPEDYEIKRLNNSFYKCNKNKILTINPDIVQYNKDIINNTIIQAFCRMKYKINSLEYKKALELASKNYDNYKTSTKLQKILKIS